VVLGSLNSAREKAKISGTKQQLSNIRSAIFLLLDDTRKAPNGCRFGTVSNPEVVLDSNQAGLMEAPTIQNNGSGCEWTASDIARWKGPYITSPLDKGDHAYIYNPDFYP